MSSIDCLDNTSTRSVSPPTGLFTPPIFLWSLWLIGGFVLLSWNQIQGWLHEQSPPLRQEVPIRQSLKRAIERQNLESVKVGPGLFSACISDASGKVWAELAQERPVLADARVPPWDGRDRDGNSAPADTYTLHTITHQGLRTSLLATPGATHSPRWERSIGNQLNVGSAVPVGNGLLLWCGGAEGAAAFGKVDRKGDYLFQSQDGWGLANSGGGMAMGVVGTKAYVLRQDRCVARVRIDADAPGLPDVPFVQIQGTTPAGDPVHLHRLDTDLAVGGVDPGNPVVVVSLQEQNKILQLNKDSLAVTRTWSVTGPLGVAVGRDNTVFVIDGSGAVLKIDPEKGTQKTFLAAGAFDTPFRLDVDAGSGDVLVATRGKDHRVYRYNSAGGQVRVYGRTGGRLNGVYVNTDFSNVMSLKCGGDGSFAVTEYLRAPRTCRWFDAEGKLILEYLGGQNYGSCVAPYPGDPRRCFISHNFGISLCSIDLATGASRVLESYTIPIEGNKWNNPVAMRAVAGHGRVYLMEEYAKIYCYDPSAKTLKGVADATFRGAASGHYRIWSDLNGDGVQTADETLDFTARDRDQNNGGIEITPDFTQLIIPGLTGSPRHKITGVSPSGAPIFAPQPPKFMPPLKANGRTYSRARFISQGPDRSWYSLYNCAIGAAVGDDSQNYGVYFQGEIAGLTRLVKIKPDLSAVVWQVGCHQGSLDDMPGRIYNASYIAGVARGCVFVPDLADAAVPRMHAYDAATGCYVGQCLARPADGFPPEALLTSGDDNWGGTAVEDPTDADAVLLYLAGFSAPRVYRVKGFAGIQRQEQPLTVSASVPAIPTEDNDGLSITYYPTADLAGPAASSRTGRCWERLDQTLPRGIGKTKSFSCLMEGKVYPTHDGPFRFCVYPYKLQSNHIDVRLWVGGVPVIRSDAGLGLEAEPYGGNYHRSAPVLLQASSPVNVRLELRNLPTAGWAGFSNSGSRVLALAWEPPGIADREYPLTLYCNSKADAAPLPARAFDVWPSLADHDPPNGLLGKWLLSSLEGYETPNEVAPGLPLYVTGSVKVSLGDHPTNGQAGNCLELTGRYGAPGMIFGPCAVSPPGDQSRQPSFAMEYFFKPISNNTQTVLCSFGRPSLLFNRVDANLIYLVDARSINIAGKMFSLPAAGKGNWYRLKLSYGPSGGFKVWVNGVLLYTGPADLERMNLPRRFLKIGPGATPSVFTHAGQKPAVLRVSGLRVWKTEARNG